MIGASDDENTWSGLECGLRFCDSRDCHEEETANPIEVLKNRALTLTRTWGESLIGYAGVSIGGRNHHGGVAFVAGRGDFCGRRVLHSRGAGGIGGVELGWRVVCFFELSDGCCQPDFSLRRFFFMPRGGPCRTLTMKK